MRRGEESERSERVKREEGRGKRREGRGKRREERGKEGKRERGRGKREEGRREGGKRERERKKRGEVGRIVHGGVTFNQTQHSTTAQCKFQNSRISQIFEIFARTKYAKFPISKISFPRVMCGDFPRNK